MVAFHFHRTLDVEHPSVQQDQRAASQQARAAAHQGMHNRSKETPTPVRLPVSDCARLCMRCATPLRYGQEWLIGGYGTCDELRQAQSIYHACTQLLSLLTAHHEAENQISLLNIWVLPRDNVTSHDSDERILLNA